MGASPSKDTALEEALSKFDDAERKAMDKLFDSLSSENHLNKGLFEQHVSKCFHETFCERIVSVVAHCSTNPAKGGSGAVTKEDFLISISHILKGSLNQKAQVLFFLASQKEQVSPNDLLELCIILVEGYIKAVQKSDLGSVYKQTGANTEANKRLAEMMLTSFSIKNLLRSVTEDDVENWLGKEILLRRLFEDAFKACFFGAHSILDKYWHGLQEGCEPTVEHVPKRTDILLPCKLDFHDHNVKPSLDMPSMLMLNHAVPTECRHIWRLLFSTACHGKSFTTFLHRIVYQGPTILLVRDAHGAVFGGFASTSWKVKSCFSGDNDCFLFTLKPTMAVYHPTGINDHYMYLNVGMQTIPNGLGMGGQFEYFGLWLDSEFGPGHSKALPKCTTYGSPQLSGSEEFQVEDIEVWGVGVPPEQEEKQRSVLDTETDAQAILDLIGKERKSEGFREPEDSD